MASKNDKDHEGVRISSFCNCENCSHWTNSADLSTTLTSEYFDDNCLNTNKLSVKKTPLLRTELNPGHKPKIIAFDYKNLTTISKIIDYSNVFIHSLVTPTPIKDIFKLPFKREVHNALKRLDYSQANIMQSFVWPAIFRQFNVFIINNEKTGKTMAYLPVIISLILQKDTFQELEKYTGPYGIILCSNTKQCEAVYGLIKKLHLFGNIVQQSVTFLSYPQINVKQTDILVTTPAILVDALKQNMFRIKRLCYLVFDNVDDMLRNDKENIGYILREADQMYLDRSANRKLQFIATAKVWSTSVELLFRKIYYSPFICFGNALEASAYGKTRYQMRFTNSSQKKEQLLELLNTNDYKISRTVIYCNPKEIKDLEIFLNNAGIKTVSLCDKNAQKNEKLFNCCTSGHYRALLCTDEIFEKYLLLITNAQYLVHYSFPTSWTKFTQRFFCLVENFQSPLNDEDKNLQSSTIIIIEENNEKQIPKLFTFLERIMKNLPEIYLNYAENLKSKREEEKLSNGKKLCDNLKIFGRCPHDNCPDRHVIKGEIDVKGYLPKNGLAFFKIIDFIDATRYSIQLKKFTTPDGKVKYCEANKIKPLIYNEQKINPEDIKIGGKYGYFDSSLNCYYPCKVYKVTDSHVRVQSFFTGEMRLILKQCLYNLSENYEEQEYSVVEAVLANTIPPFKDENFSTRCADNVLGIFGVTIEGDRVFCGSVCLQLDNTLWLENIEEKIVINNHESVYFNLKRSLKKAKLAEFCEMPLRNLSKLCIDSGIEFVNSSVQKSKKSIKKREKKFEYQEAFIDDEIHEVILSCGVNPEEFYVRLSKYENLLLELQKDIKNEVNQLKVQSKGYTPSIGDVCLAKDEKNTEYCRAKILNIKDDKLLVFYVDYGDEAITDFQNIKPISTHLIKKLPFQAIQCGLYGVAPVLNHWQESANDALFNYTFEPNSDFYRSLFVKKVEELTIDSLRIKNKNIIILKDGYSEKGTIINKLLIDCGFAKQLNDIEDFEIPEIPDDEYDDLVGYSDESPIEIVENGNLDENNEEIEEINNPNNDEGFELFVDDDEEFLKQWRGVIGRMSAMLPANIREEIGLLQNRALPRPSGLIQNQIEYEEIPENPGECLKSDHLTPEVYWSQTKEKVHLRIQLIGVEDYTVKLHMKKIFEFRADLDNKNYKLKFSLSNAAKLESHKSVGQEVRVVFRKVKENEWMQLTLNSKKMRNIHYEYHESELQEPPSRRFLTLDIPDQDDGGEEPLIIDVSDLDSEFDQDIPTDYSD